MLVLVIVSLMAVVISDGVMTDGVGFKKSVRVQRNGETDASLNISSLDLYPGSTEEYELSFEFELGGDYVMNIDFVEKGDCALKNFVNVEVYFNSFKLEDTLANFIDAKSPYSLDFYMEANVTKTLTVKFIMPATVGNEAQGAMAKFDIDFSVKALMD